MSLTEDRCLCFPRFGLVLDEQYGIGRTRMLVCRPVAGRWDPCANMFGIVRDYALLQLQKVQTLKTELNEEIARVLPPPAMKPRTRVMTRLYLLLIGITDKTSRTCPGIGNGL